MKIKIPIEYQRGFVKFLNCKINLSQRVFIPRIETEFWVKKAIKEIKKERSYSHLKIRILDIFAGSGCVGIAILKNIKNSFVDFIDIDKRAVEQIKTNLKLNKIVSKRYRVYQSDVFKKFQRKKLVPSQKYDFIFANPPYVAKERLKEVEPSVLKYEPRGAIISGLRGLFHIKKLLKEERRFLKKAGIVYLEFDPKQKEDIKNILKKEGYKNFRFFKDQFKKYRFLKANF